MTFISYAQNLEDLMLWRALQHIDNGFYIDIGAQDPIEHSVSLAFYKAGWRGVHVEPTKQYADKLHESRPDETILQVAISNTTGFLTFYEFPDTGLSTADEKIAEQHANHGYVYHKTIIPVLSLDILLHEFQNKKIHWLKIDVEGSETQVLQSWTKSLVRPWILVIESTLPNTQILSHQHWEYLVLSKGYKFAYFDGLNRFYIYESKIDLIDKFSAPPNIFDNFITCETFNLDKKNKSLALTNLNLEQENLDGRKIVKDLHEQIAQHLNLSKELNMNVHMLSEQLQQVHNSKSWKITKPLRLFSGKIKPIINKLISSCLNLSLKLVYSQPKLKIAAKKMLKLYPSLYKHIDKFSINYSGQKNNGYKNKIINLSPYTLEIYNKLQQIVRVKAKNKKEK